MTIKKLHRNLGLLAAAFWLVQALTGAALTFRQELDNATLSGKSVPVLTAALGSRIQLIQQAGGRVSSLWVANFAADRFDVRYVDSAAAERLMRVDGAGRIMRDGLENTPFENGGLFRTLTLIHTTLLAGEVGQWIIALSGLLLISNIVLGLKLAWPRAGMWRQSLVLRPSRNAAARFYGIHRTVGLWLAIPLLLVVVVGVALRFDDTIERALGVVRLEPVDAPVGLGIAPAQALDIALARFPGSTITALSMPTKSDAWYRVRMRAVGEVPRMYGTTTLFLSAVDGSVLKEYAAGAASPTRAFFDMLYPLHTGELGALPGRLLLLAVGVLLLVMGAFGIRLWLLRRKAR